MLLEQTTHGGAAMTVKFPLQQLNATFASASANGERRTAEVTWYTGAEVDRYDWLGRHTLRLSMDPAHVRMGRLASGNAPLLNSHRDYELKDILGVVEKAWLEKGTGKAVVRFTERADVEPIFRDVKAGIIRNANWSGGFQDEGVRPRMGTRRSRTSRPIGNRAKLAASRWARMNRPISGWRPDRRNDRLRN